MLLTWNLTSYLSNFPKQVQLQSKKLHRSNGISISILSIAATMQGGSTGIGYGLKYQVQIPNKQISTTSSSSNSLQSTFQFINPNFVFLYLNPSSL